MSKVSGLLATAGLLVVVLGAASHRWLVEWLYLAGVGSSASFVANTDSVSVPVRLVRNLVFVPVRYQGRDASFIFDSGLQFSVLNADRAHELGVELHGSRQVPSGGMGKRISVSFASPTPILIGQSELRPRRLPAIPLSFLEPYVGEPIHGIIGHDLLAAAPTRLSYIGRTLTLWNADRFTAPSDAEAIPVEIRSREAFVQVTLTSMTGEHTTAQLKLDTGSPSIIGLDGGLVRRTGLLPKNQVRREVPGIGLTGETQGQAFLLRGARLGGQSFDTLLAQTTLADSHNTAGVIGAEILRHFTLTFDYGHKLLWLKPAGQEPTRVRYDRSGLTLLAKGAEFDALVVYFVEPGSPGARAGVLTGDVIERIDETGTAALTLAGVVTALEAADSVVTLEILRQGQPLSLRLRLPHHYPAP